MPKVLRIINRLNLGGPTYNASYLTKHLAPEFETMLLAGMKDESEASSSFIPESMGIEPVTIRSMRRSLNPFKDVSTYREIKGIIRDFKPDIVHTHAAKAGALGRQAAYELKVPVIIHTFHGHVFHSYFNNIISNVFVNIERNLARKSSRIIAISNLQKKELVEDFKIAPAEKVAVIPLGFNLEKFRENIDLKRDTFRKNYQLSEDEVAVGIIGRIVPIKNHEMFLKAVQRLAKDQDLKARYFIIGDGEDTVKMKSMATEMGIDWSWKQEGKSLLTFTSWIKEIDVANAGLDIVCLCSLNEGTPVSLIEAQAAGKPVVSTDVGGVQDAVIKGDTALLCNSGDDKTFASLLKQLILSKEIRDKMSRSGFSHVSDKFSYNRLVEDMRRLYHQLLHI